MTQDKWNIPHINESLSKYLDKEDFDNYSSLIKSVIKNDNEPEAKYNLMCLLMNQDYLSSCVDSLRNKAKSFYKTGKSLNSHMQKVVQWNGPIVGGFTIQPTTNSDKSFNLETPKHIMNLPNDVGEKYRAIDNYEKNIQDVIALICKESRFLIEDDSE